MNEQKTICPLLAIASSANQQAIPAHCLENHCAWYDGIQCAVLTIAEQVGE